MEKVPKSTILLAYRHLYQHLLRAVKYSQPARYIARDRIRAAFRNSRDFQRDFQPAEISRTLDFLDNAAKYRGLEHRIVKNCMQVWWARSPSSGEGMGPVRKEDRALRQSAYTDFDETIRKLNETMGLCIK